MKTLQKGFSLVELLVVVAIIGVLAGVGIVGYQGYTDSAKQRVAVARALINSPSIILADEPSGNLDSKNAEELHNLLLKLNKELGQTFVIITHNKELANLGSRKLEMKDGKII